MGFVSFMSSAAGRITRALAGLILLGVGLALVLGSPSFILGLVLMALGVVFVAVGVFDVCLLAPLFRLPMSGVAVRERSRAM